jgi:hypothetical protein
MPKKMPWATCLLVRETRVNTPADADETVRKAGENPHRLKRGWVGSCGCLTRQTPLGGHGFHGLL